MTSNKFSWILTLTEVISIRILRMRLISPQSTIYIIGMSDTMKSPYLHPWLLLALPLVTGYIYITFPQVNTIWFFHIIFSVAPCGTFGLYHLTIQSLGLYRVFCLAYNIVCLFHCLFYIIHSLECRLYSLLCRLYSLFSVYIIVFEVMFCIICLYILSQRFELISFWKKMYCFCKIV